MKCGPRTCNWFLLALILAGVLRPSLCGPDVRYKGPVVYTDLPPPVLYFPSFPAKPKLSKRDDGEEKRLEYVPYPYKDLPLLVYQSESQPPVHVVQKSSESQDDKYINVGLSTSAGPPVDPSNPQYISIAVQPQSEDAPVQYASAADYVQYATPSSDQGSPSVRYYSGDSQARIPVEQLGQVIQNYLVQQGGATYQHEEYESVPAVGESGQHVGITIIRQPDSQPRHPGYEDVANQQYVSIGVYPFDYGQQQSYYGEDEAKEEEYRGAKEQPAEDYGSPQGDEYRQAKPPAYQASNDNYRPQQRPTYHHSMSMSEDYRSAGKQSSKMNEEYRQGGEKTANEPAQTTTGYQVISIDLSALRQQQNAEQQRAVNPTYVHPEPTSYMHPAPEPAPYRHPAPEPTPYRHPAPEPTPYRHPDREKEYRQILIQIPHKMLSEPEKPVQGRGPNETPYTGTAQVANANKAPYVPPPTDSGPLHQPPQNKARHPKEVHRMPQGGLLPNGINIAIIKQSDSSHNAPLFKSPSDKRPQYHPPLVRHPSPPRPNVHRMPASPAHRFGTPNRPFSHKTTTVRLQEGPVVARTPYPIPVMGYNHHRPSFSPNRPKPRLPHFSGHPGLFASSNLHYTTITPDGSKPQVFGAPTQAPFPFEAALNNIPNADVNFDDINAFLNPGYDLFGAMTNGPDKKKVEDETKFLQKVTSDLLTHEMNVPAPPKPPPPNALGAPFPYKYWEQQQPVRNGDRLQNIYSHLQHPHVRGNKRFPTVGRKRGLGKGYRGLKRKLSALRSSIRGKSKIAPRVEEASEEGGNVESSVPKIASLIAGTKAFGNLTPAKRRTTLDGISIPLHPEHVLSSRISTDDEEGEDAKMPPIIVYKGSKPPVEIYGTKEDIEGGPKENSTAVEESASTVGPDASKESPERADGAGYMDYVYSMLPDLVRSSFHRRYDDDGSKWQPVKYALAEDSDGNETTTTEKPREAEVVPKVSEAQSSSSESREFVEENVEELFSLLGKEEKSDLNKER